MAVKRFCCILLLPVALLLVTSTPAYSLVVSPSDDTSDIGDVIQRVTGIIETFLRVVTDSAVNIARLFYCVMAIIGSILWTSRLDRLMGRDLIMGAVLLAFVSEFIIPVILH